MTRTNPRPFAPAAPGRGASRRLYVTALYLWLGAAGTALAGFAFWTVVARLFSPHDVGLGAAAFSALALLALFSPLGLGTGLIRFLPGSGERGPRLANGAFTAGAVLAALSSLVFLMGVPLWTPRLQFLLDRPFYGIAFVAFAVAATLSTMLTQALMAVRRPRYLLAQIGAVQVSRLALPALLAVFFGAFGIILAAGLAFGLGTLLGFVLLGRGLAGYRPRPVFDVRSVSGLVPFSLGNYAADVLLLAPGLILPLLVVAMLGSEQGAYFYIAWFLGYLLTSASTHLALSLFAEGSHDPGSLLALSRSALAAGLAVAVGGGLCLALVGDKVLLAFGGDYASEGAALLRIVALAAVPAAAVNVYLGAMRVSKRVGELVAVAGTMAATTLVLSYVLLPVAGLEGAGIAFAAAQGLGLTIVFGRTLMDLRGPVPQRMRRLLVTLAAGS